MATRKILNGLLVEFGPKEGLDSACSTCAMNSKEFGCTTVDEECMGEGSTGMNWKLIDAEPEISEVDGKTYYRSMKLPQCSGDWIEFTDPDKDRKNRHDAKENN